MALYLTDHARKRIARRRISQDDLAAALADTTAVTRGGQTNYFDRKSGTVVAVRRDRIVTAYKVKAR